MRSQFLGSASLGVDPVTGRGSGTLPTLEQPTWVEVKIEGGVKMVTPQGQVDYTFGPRGLWWVSDQFYGCGMKVTVQYSAPYPDHEKLQAIAGDDAASQTFNANVEKLNRLMFTFLDYAVVDRKP